MKKALIYFAVTIGMPFTVLGFVLAFPYYMFYVGASACEDWMLTWKENTK